MSLCINPFCPQPDHSDNANNRFCQSCGSHLLLENRYRVMRLLSDNSGFGKIYEAYESSTPKILKVLKEHLNNHAKAVELFQQEAAVLAKLDHPGIPKVDGYFQYLTNHNLRLHCLVMEKIDGVNLEQWLQQHSNNPISEKQALAWLKQLAEILQIVHSKQWFHRDIKPANVMLRSNGQLVLIDFGTARDATYTYLAKLGVGHQITAVVSAGYTPAEQMNYQAVPQSDFFALGRTFVHLLTGEHPLKFYDAHNDVFHWRQAVTISPLLGNFIDQLMARKPGDRPLNTQVLLQRLGEIEQKTFQHSKKKLPVAVPVVALLLLGGGFGYLASKIGQSPLSPISTTSPTAKIPNPLTNLSLAQTLPSEPYTNTGHTDKICIGDCIAISRDNSILVSGSYDKTIKIWNLPDGTLIRTLTDHSGGVSSVAISPDGQTLVSGSRDKTIKIWQIADGTLIRTLTGHSSSVFSVAMSKDGQTLVSSSADKTIKIWQIADGTLIRTLTGDSDYVNSVAISPDGQTLVSGSGDKTIKIWQIADGILIRTLTGHSRSVSSVAISPDGRTLVSGSNDKTIKIWNLPDGTLIRTLTDHSGGVSSVAISPDGQTLVSGSGDKTIKIWNLADGTLIRTLTGHSSSVYSVAISPDGRTLVSGSADKTIKIWRASS
ncbi:serine/threonine protein kinase [Scytonema hofmannii FACHB-248]|uniref:Serine/threonine protein kinase n=1 Tax=Scytonema hofmannii FACHB-248 TaxID=1842502 RepID=A0ABR8GL46_9CYAN|nr:MULTISPECIES: serine/threonine-protein kinase [Nostocales]MBD2603463.1 serine/threonine protein kinase [Scytonema hofmannii FACHB-248]